MVFPGLKNIIITTGEDNSIKFEFKSFDDLSEALNAMIEIAIKVKEAEKILESKDEKKIAENLAKMIKETMEKAPNQIVHFGEITKDGEVKEITPEEFAEKYLKGGERKRKRGEDNE